MKDCYHTTKIKFLQSILKDGLKPIYGDNSSLTADSRVGKVSYSVGKQGAANTFDVFRRFYNSVLEGNINEDHFRESLSEQDLKKHQESIEGIRSASSFEDCISDNIYLCFDGNCLSEKNEDKSEDSYTSQTIPANQLKVCVIKNIQDNKIESYSMLDIYSMFFAKNPELRKGLATYRYKDKIEKFKSDKYQLDFIDLEKFCEMHPEVLQENTSKKQQISTEDIGKRCEKANFADKETVTGIFSKWKKRILEMGFSKE